MKRSGFTMIELVFVIVILGILASVAIPKLAATRDDAKISATATSVNTLISDVTTYYTAQGDVNSSTIQEITNVSTGSGWSTTWAANAINYQFSFEDSLGTTCLSVDVNTSATDGVVSVSLAGVDTTTAVCNGLSGLLDYGTTVKLGGRLVNY